MKNFCLLLGGMLLLTLSPIAQNKKVCNPQNDCCKFTKKQPVVAKGYYAIGNNSSQLAKSTSALTCCKNNGTSLASTHQPKITKGYYAIGTGKDSLLKKQPAYATSTQPKPVSKGYYAVGNNHQKLGNKDGSLKSCDCDCC